MRIMALAAPPLTLARMLVLVVLVLKTFVGGRAHVPLESETAQIAWYMNVGGCCQKGKGQSMQLWPMAGPRTCSIVPALHGVRSLNRNFLQTKLYAPDDSCAPVVAAHNVFPTVRGNSRNSFAAM